VNQVKMLLEQPLPKWLPDTPSQKELLTFETEALRDSQFDPLQLRPNLWRKTIEGGAQILCQSCEYAKVLWIQENDTGIEPSWSDWSRVFQWLGHSQTGEKWTVYWFPAHIQRILPRKGNVVGPESINGGYCFPCEPTSIVVYRYEEATRVLIHELLHAACTDPPGAPLPIKEATTETWAELFLVALCSKGDEQKAKQFWKLQSQWISNQNHALQKHYHVRSPEDYAWRYTVGRAFILQDLRISLPSAKPQTGNSSRLTHPSLCV
jgi:hypothetical protein